MTNTTPTRRESDNGIELERGRRAPYTQLGDWIALAPVSHAAARLYHLLAAHLNKARGDSLVWPSRGTLAAMMRYSRPDKIDPLLKQLEDIGAIDVERGRRYPDGSPAPNLYVVHETPPPAYEGEPSIERWYATRKEEQEKKRQQRLAARAGGSQGSPEKRATGSPEKRATGSPEKRATGSPEKRAQTRRSKELDETKPPSPTPPGTAASSAAGAAEAGRQGADDFETQKIQSGQADDAAHARAAEIISAIDWPARCRVDQGTQLRLVALASRCLAAGHSVGAVQAAVTEDLPAVWGAGLLVRRLQDLAENQRTDAGASSARVETPHQFEAGKSPGYCCVCGRRQENRLHRSLPQQLPSEEQLAAEWLTLSGRRQSKGHQPWRNPADQGAYDLWAPAEERATETAQAGDRCEHGRRVCVTCHGGKSGVSRPAPRPRSAAEQQLVEMSRGPAAA